MQLHDDASAHILVIDDDRRIGQTLLGILSSLGHQAVHADTLEAGVQMARRERFDLVFLDVRLPDGSGLERLSEIRETASRPEVVVITGFASHEGAENAICKDAWAYLKKPVSLAALKNAVTGVLDYRKQKGQTPIAFRSVSHEEIIGKSPRLSKSLIAMARAAMSQANTLITGETGTGKELFARAVHKNSSRRDGNFVVVDCGSLPEHLIESVLFGHKKGSFTGADRSEPGLVLHANGGTLFLDEVGELPLSMQKTFLRVLEHHCFRPVGDIREEHSDFRLIAATNRDLEKMAREHLFREDLLFRLQAVIIELPPLREREGDIPLLAEAHIRSLCRKNNLPPKSISPCFHDALELYDWPGNVRELKNSLDWAFTHALDCPVLYSRHLPHQIRVKVAQRQVGPVEGAPLEQGVEGPDMESWKDFRQNMLAREEKQYLKRLLSFAGWNVRKAVDVSGLSQARLYELLKKYDIPSKPSPD
ncbi:MAG: sigma-54 dependent transcriptional regulator [Thermodesulfobacteriota bacterium]